MEELRRIGLTDKGVVHVVHLVSDFASYNRLNIALGTDYDYRDMWREIAFGWKPSARKAPGDTRGVRTEELQAQAAQAIGSSPRTRSARRAATGHTRQAGSAQAGASVAGSRTPVQGKLRSATTSARRIPIIRSVCHSGQAVASRTRHAPTPAWASAT